MKKVILLLSVLFMVFLVTGCEKEKKLDLTMSSTVDYVVRKLDGEYHLLKVSSDGIKDLHVFKNNPKNEYPGIVFAGFENNRGYYVMDKAFYYIDFDTDEEVKWLESLDDYIKREFTAELLEDVGEDSFDIDLAMVMDGKIYFRYGSYGVYNVFIVSTNAKTIDEIESMNDKLGVNLLSSIDEMGYDYANNKMYFKARNNDGAIYIYEYDVKRNILIPHVEYIKTQRRLDNLKFINGNIVFSAWTEVVGEESLFIYNLNTKEIKEIGKFNGEGFKIEVYDNKTVMYRDKDYPNNVTLYNTETGEKSTLNDTAGFDFADYGQEDSIYLHYKGGIYYRIPHDYAYNKPNTDNIIYGTKLVNKNTLTDSFEITNKSGNKTEIKLVEILK